MFTSSAIKNILIAGVSAGVTIGATVHIGKNAYNHIKRHNIIYEHIPPMEESIKIYKDIVAETAIREAGLKIEFTNKMYQYMSAKIRKGLMNGDIKGEVTYGYSSFNIFDNTDFYIPREGKIKLEKDYKLGTSGRKIITDKTPKPDHQEIIKAIEGRFLKDNKLNIVITRKKNYEYDYYDRCPCLPTYKYSIYSNLSSENESPLPKTLSPPMNLRMSNRAIYEESTNGEIITTITG